MLNSSRMAFLLQRQKESGLSVKSFCSNEGIVLSTFYYWKKKLRTEDIGRRFIPLLVRAPGSSVVSPASAENHNSVTDHTPLEITYANGTTLRIRQTLDLAGLRSLVTLLD